MSIRVILDGKIGSSSTTDPKDVDGVVARVLEAAEFGSPAHFELPGPRQGTDVKVYDDAVLPVSKQEMVRIGEEMLAVVKEFNGDILVDAGAGKSAAEAEFANSAGVRFATKNTSFGVGVSGVWIRGTDILWAGHGSGWKKRELDHMTVARKAVEFFRMAEKLARISSGEMPVIFTPQGMHVLLLSLRMGFNGKNVVLGASPLSGKLGQKIADARFSVIDDPLIDYAAASSKYDGEGVPRQVTSIIENGVLENFLYDLDTAGRAATESTGHGIGCSPTNLVIGEGDTPYEEMIRGTKEGLLVHSVMGLGQGNPMSGEFSVNVQLGYKIEDGEIVGRVKDVMLAGNTYDALKSIEAIGDKAEWVGGTLLAPPMKIGGLSVVAN
jgi:PmbA protein